MDGKFWGWNSFSVILTGLHGMAPAERVAVRQVKLRGRQTPGLDQCTELESGKKLVVYHGNF